MLTEWQQFVEVNETAISKILKKVRLLLVSVVGIGLIFCSGTKHLRWTSLETPQLELMVLVTDERNISTESCRNSAMLQSRRSSRSCR